MKYCDYNGGEQGVRENEVARNTNKDKCWLHVFIDVWGEFFRHVFENSYIWFSMVFEIMRGKEEVLSENGFPTEDFLGSVLEDLRRFNPANYRENESYSSLIKSAVGLLREAVEKILGSIIIERIREENDNLSVWEVFLKNYTPSPFEKGAELRNIYALLGVCEIISNEVKVSGSISSSMDELRTIIDKAMCLPVNDNEKEFYYKVWEDYKNRYIFWFQDSRNEARMKAYYKDLVNKKFDDLKEERDKYINDLKIASKEISISLEDNRDLLDALKDDASFASLFRGFDNYGKQLRSRIIQSNVEKYVLVFFVILIPVLGVVLQDVFSLSVWQMSPFVGGFLLVGILLKVCLKRTDQLEQVLSKVEHKLAVSAFYENRINHISDEKEKELASIEYYRFIFSKIETAEWNAPDITDAVSGILDKSKRHL